MSGDEFDEVTNRCRCKTEVRFRLTTVIYLLLVDSSFGPKAVGRHL